MKESAYSFTVPSLHDDIQLDCRIYHPTVITASVRSRDNLKGAVIAHPYAPLGGCFDDTVVLQLAELLLNLNFVVVTFNFRGAGESAGRTSWTGRPEVDDYASVIGLTVYYLNNLRSTSEPKTLSHIISAGQPEVVCDAPGEGTSRRQSLNLLLAGYSFGSLILTRLPSVSAIIQRFETAEHGTSAAEIFLRARILAKQTRSSSLEGQDTLSTPRGRKLHPDDSPTKSNPSRGSPVVVGGEETYPADRRRSRDSRRSGEVMREIPHNIRSHLRRQSEQFSRSPSGKDAAATEYASQHMGGPSVTLRYLLISPVLVPFTRTLLPPGLPFTAGFADASLSQSGVLSLRFPTFVAFGSLDTFTSSKKLRQWAEKLAEDSDGSVKWEQIEGAGHFWREKGVMKTLQMNVKMWLTHA